MANEHDHMGFGHNNGKLNYKLISPIIYVIPKINLNKFPDEQSDILMRLLIEGGLDAAAEHYAYLAQLVRRAAQHDISEYIGREQNMAEAVHGTNLSFQTNASMYQYMRDSLGARTIEEAHGKLAHGQVPQHIVEVWLDDGYITRHDALGAIRAGYPMLDVNGLLLRNLLG